MWLDPFLLGSQFKWPPLQEAIPVTSRIASPFSSFCFFLSSLQSVINLLFLCVLVYRQPLPLERAFDQSKDASVFTDISLTSKIVPGIQSAPSKYWLNE